MCKATKKTQPFYHLALLSSDRCWSHHSALISSAASGHVFPQTPASQTKNSPDCCLADVLERIQQHSSGHSAASEMQLPPNAGRAEAALVSVIFTHVPQRRAVHPNIG